VDSSADPELGAERIESLKSAILLVFEKLSPTERAVYILREAFDYSYDRIAEILQIEEVNTRQLVSRARKRIADGRRTFLRSGQERRFLGVFMSAAKNGNMAALETFFIEDISSYSARAGTDSNLRMA